VPEVKQCLVTVLHKKANRQAANALEFHQFLTISYSCFQWYGWSTNCVKEHIHFIITHYII